jgi:hypothetical protein
MSLNFLPSNRDVMVREEEIPPQIVIYITSGGTVSLSDAAVLTQWENKLKLSVSVTFLL